MNSRLVRAVLAGAMLAQAPVAFAQSAIVDLKDFRPREVKSTVFSVASAQDVRVEAVGAESDSNRGTFSWVSSMWNGKRSNGHDDERRDPWMGNAWILDLKSRRVVWDLSAASTERGRRNTRAFVSTVRLPAGTYEAFYSAFPSSYWTDEDGNAAQRFLAWLADEGFDQFHLTIRGGGQALSGAEADRARHEFETGAIVALRGNAGEKFLQAGFALSRPMQVEIYAAGEAREDAEFDAGWIINADTREKLWKLTWRDSAPAGGAVKNRMARLTKTLPAGRYAAFYATDDSHDQSQWNSAPPHDPQAWGLLVRVMEAEAGGTGGAVKSFPYEHVPAASTIVALTKVGDREARTRGFTLNRAMDVRVYALGEGRDRLVDYGWITSATTRQKVWEMRYADTEPAGGDAKNRLVDRTIRLDKGDYIVHYITDDSHSFDEWNAAAPSDGQHWGITLLAAQGPLDRSAIGEYTEKPDPAVLAQLVRLRDDERPRKTFRLDRETQVRIYALGEGTGRSLADYGWIEDAKTGRTVWEMTYRVTEPAGGAAKNRRFDGVVTLPAGDYVLRYETDGSHAFGAWNAAAPDDPEMWGITVYRVR